MSGELSKRAIEGELPSLEKSILLDLTRTVAKELFAVSTRPWEALYSLEDGIIKIGERLPFDEYDEIGDGIFVHVSAYLSPSARIEGPAIIGGGARICNSVTLSHSVVGAFCTVGESSYLGNSIMFDRSKLIGQNHVNSSIIGYNSVVGAGCVIPRERLDGANILFDLPEGIYVTGKRKLGAIICDGARIGSLCVVNPGAIVAEGACVMPLSSVSGYVRGDKI